MEEYGLSVNAISGIITCNPIRIKGQAMKLPLIISIDIGNTHSFVEILCGLSELSLPMINFQFL